MRSRSRLRTRASSAPSSCQRGMHYLTLIFIITASPLLLSLLPTTRGQVEEASTVQPFQPYPYPYPYPQPPYPYYPGGQRPPVQSIGGAIYGGIDLQPLFGGGSAAGPSWRYGSPYQQQQQYSPYSQYPYAYQPPPYQYQYPYPYYGPPPQPYGPYGYGGGGGGGWPGGPNPAGYGPYSNGYLNGGGNGPSPTPNPGAKQRQQPPAVQFEGEWRRSGIFNQIIMRNPKTKS